MNYTKLSLATKAVVLRYIGRRGLTPEQLESYLDPELDPAKYVLPHADKAAARLEQAIRTKEKVFVLGDYDADGVTCTAILVRFLGECTSLRPMWRLPSRKTDNYGLDLEAARKIATEHNPTLVVCLDHGTNSRDAVAWLHEQGVDVIVIDHHPVTCLAVDAIAMVNPKAHPGSPGDLDTLCAAGLTLFFCDYLALAWNCCDKWDHVTATMLASIGTLADASPMSATNRAIVKGAIFLLNTPAARQRCPGLMAIVPDDGQRISQRRIEYEIVPPINALGRLDDPDPGVVLFTTTNTAEAERIAKHCRALNGDRKALQQVTVAQAIQQARPVLDRCPALSLLVLAHPDWNAGVVGPCASRVAEHLGRSAILLGSGREPGEWKGSGRSHNADNIGAWLEVAKEKGLVERGGGHAGAVGLGLRSDQIKLLRNFAEHHPMPIVKGLEPKTEVVGELDELRPEEWMAAITAIEPSGCGNPAPLISARNAKLISDPIELKLKTTGLPWALKADFAVGRLTVSAVWSDHQKAVELWKRNAVFDLRVELSAKLFNGKIYYNWSVVGCWQAGVWAGTAAVAPTD